MRTLDIHWPDLPTGVGVLSTLRSGGVSTGAYADAVGGGGLNLGTHVGDAPEAVAEEVVAEAAAPVDVVEEVAVSPEPVIEHKKEEE